MAPTSELKTGSYYKRYSLINYIQSIELNVRHNRNFLL